MLQDMENLRTILRLLAASEPDMDYNPIADEYTKEVRKELDFCNEAENMKQTVVPFRSVSKVMTASSSFKVDVSDA